MRTRITLTATVVLALAVFGATSAEDPNSPKAVPSLKPGSILVLELTGVSSGGPVWETGVYTGDSSLAAASVHAGLLPDGGSGPVLVHVLAGQSSYTGGTSHGVSSSDYGTYGLSYSLEALRWGP